MTSFRNWKLRRWPDEVLHTKCIEGAVPKGLVEYMTAVLQSNRAVGLACSQVGETSCRVFVMRDLDKRPGEVLAFVNPIIIEKSTETYVDSEACLSFPSQRIRLARAKTVSIGFDTPGNVRTIQKFEGLNARCIQHEIDHLDGIMIFDRIVANIIRKNVLVKYTKKMRKHATLL